MVYDEAYDYLWQKLASGQDRYATRRLKDYQRKRLRRAQLALALRPYFLEAFWTNTAGTAGETNIASTQPTTEPLFVLDAAVRTTTAVQGSADNNNLEILLYRTGGDSRVQISKTGLKDEHLFTPAQCALRNVLGNVAGGNPPKLGHGAPWPLTWPVPLEIWPNELLQLTSSVLTGGMPAGSVTFVQFRCININNEAENEQLIADLRAQIVARDQQRPIYLNMASRDAHSIAFDATGASQRITAKTREAESHLLVLGYSVALARQQAGVTADDANGFTNGPFSSAANPRWRLQGSSGYGFSKEEIDISTFAFAGPGWFWQQLPAPFLLPKGSSLSASFSTLNAIANAFEQTENYVIFRCVEV